jgi:hypothetical protein
MRDEVICGTVIVTKQNSNFELVPSINWLLWVTNLNTENLLICEILPIAFLKLSIKLDKLVESSAAERDNHTQIIPFQSLTFSDRQICSPNVQREKHTNLCLGLETRSL